jgi:hypothetical protein
MRNWIAFRLCKLAYHIGRLAERIDPINTTVTTKSTTNETEAS